MRVQSRRQRLISTRRGGGLRPRASAWPPPLHPGRRPRSQACRRVVHCPAVPAPGAEKGMRSLPSQWCGQMSPVTTMWVTVPGFPHWMHWGSDGKVPQLRQRPRGPTVCGCAGPCP